ncbi:kelch-like protein 5 [Temnothorax curvispinosus]|uniref:Kelch-like protein 5 n=1 Tax=Temnothorax curvispinosus TaxID=300111 RepID=A0A6J1PU96_9HYME|nr:kelch-like protein 5 [Temnothorax curvispinosus]
MSKRRDGVGVGVVNGCLYALGGNDSSASNPNFSRFDCVERYDPKTDTWTMVAPMSVPRSEVGVCVLGDRLMAVGGYDGQQCLTLVEAYDPHLNEWEPVAPLKTGRAGLCVAVVKNLTQ